MEIKNLTKTYEDGEKIFSRFNIKFTENTVNAIIGSSGCGKTTLLNIAAGLLKYDSGEKEGFEKKNISYIFQEDRLVNWLTAEENLEFALKQYYFKEDLKIHIKELIKLVRIEGYEKKYPEELSGGMKQRVNIARAFGKPSSVILMDEPFKSLDYKLKYEIIDDFINILKNKPRTVILVTHDPDEAIYFNGRIVVLGGRPVHIKGDFSENLLENKERILKEL